MNLQENMTYAHMWYLNTNTVTGAPQNDNHLMSDQFLSIQYKIMTQLKVEEDTPAL